MATMGMKALTLGRLEVVIALHTQNDPLPDEWENFVDLQAKTRKKLGDDLSRIRNVVVTDGGAPNAKQRDLLTKAFGGGSVKVGVITTSLTNPIKRGIATAITWANPGFKAVLPEQWQDALQHLNLEGQIQPILFELERLQAKLPQVNSLAVLATQVRKHVA